MSRVIQDSTLQASPSSREGSRRERKKERTRQEIYRAAMELCMTRGFDEVTIDDICQAADVAKGTFFLHFPTKDALLLEYGRQVCVELEEILAHHRGGAKAALRKILDVLAERATRHASIVHFVVREVMARPVALADATAQSRDLMHLLAEVVRRGQRDGELRSSVAPRLAAGIVTAAYFAIITEWVRCGGAFDLAGAIQQSLDVVLNGLAHRARRASQGD